MSTWLYRLGAALAVSAAVSGCEAPAPLADEAPLTDSDAIVEAEQDGVAGQSDPLFFDKKPKITDKAARIAVIGAGPSGLAAATALEDLGFENVTVFEKDNRVGGKVFSRELAPGNIAELGAVFASSDYTYTLAMAQKYGIETAAYGGIQTILDAKGRHSGEEFLTSRYNLAQIGAAVAAYGIAQLYYGKAAEPGFVHEPQLFFKGLDQNFDSFSRSHGIEPITEAAKSVMVGFGYGYYETAPAAYFWKLLPWLMKIGGPKLLQPAQYLTFPTGFQSVWTAVAGDLDDVRLNSLVTSVRREGQKVYLSVDHGAEQEFDYVIISAPLNKVGSFVDLDNHESDLFAKVRGLHYFVSLFGAGGLVNGEALFFHDNAVPSRINHVNVWANREAGAPFVGYQIAEPNLSPEAAEGVLAADVASQNGLFAGIIRIPKRNSDGSIVLNPDGSPVLEKVQQEWDNYFPHVSSDEMKAGFYKKVEDLQGKKNTFYVGGTLSFETVEHSAQYADALVRKNFQ